MSENVEQDVPAAVYQRPDENKTRINLASDAQIDSGRGFRNGWIRVQAEAAQGAAAAATDESHLWRAQLRWRVGGASTGRGHTLSKKIYIGPLKEVKLEGLVTSRIGTHSLKKKKKVEARAPLWKRFPKNASRNKVGVKYKLITAEAHLQAINSSKNALRA